MRKLFLIPLMVLAGCGDISAPERDNDRFLQTDELEYLLESDANGRGFLVAYSYSNPLPYTLYIENCNGQFGVSLERRRGSKWVSVWSPVVDSCLSQPIAIAPGATYRAALYVYGAKAGSNTYPQFPAGDLDGLYRFRIADERTVYRAGSPGSAGGVSADLLISNEFALVDP